VEAKIVGLRGSGKSALLEALAAGAAGSSGIVSVKVADSRIRKLSEMWSPKKTTFAEFRTREADWPQGDGKKAEMTRYLDSLAGADVFLHVVRAFDNPMLGTDVTPVADLHALDGEFIMGDLLAIERAFERDRKQPMSGNLKKALGHAKECLEAETPLREVAFDETDLREMRGYSFLTLVPQVVVANTSSEVDVDLGAIEGAARGRKLVAFPVDAAREVAELTAEERMEFAEALGLPGPADEVVTRAVFEEMGLVSFFTMGPDEVRAWPIQKGWNARRAAGVIHSDLERGFIRAETVSFDDFVAHGDTKKCRDAGVLRLEGKDYEVRDGDILNIRFNV
jgi:hypothetical protein